MGSGDSSSGTMFQPHHLGFLTIGKFMNLCSGLNFFPQYLKNMWNFVMEVLMFSASNVFVVSAILVTVVNFYYIFMTELRIASIFVLLKWFCRKF